MKKLIALLLISAWNFIMAQPTCYDKANAYRNAKFDFDSVFIRIRQAQEMIMNCDMPNDSFINLERKKKKTGDYKGKPTVINFWYLHCPPCINEIPSFNELSKKYGHKINILAISQDKKADIQAFLSKHSFKAEIVSDAENFINKYNLGSGYPFTLLLNKEGKIVFVKSEGGETPESQLDLYKDLSPLIDALLADKKN
jgi:thiol-disulfide isomerase/thioredoxin